MRPKKVIFLIIGESDYLSILSFMFTCQGYKVEPFPAAEPALKFLNSGGSYDLLIASSELGSSSGDDLIVRAKHVAPNLPAILITPKGKPVPEHHSDCCLAQPVTAADLLERVKVMSARKRGPQLGCHRKPKPVVSEPASVDQSAALAMQGA